MASGEDARNIPPSVATICHSDMIHKYVVCILCDASFCHSDFVRKVVKGKGFFISNSSVVCPNHNLKYSSKHVNDIKNASYDGAMILQLKLNLIKKELEMLSVCDKDNSDISSDNNIQGSDSTLTIHEICAESEVLKNLNYELNKNNEELTENNRFLRKMLENAQPAASLSYATVAGNGYEHMTKRNNHVPKITVKAKNENSKKYIYNTVALEIQKCNIIKVESFFSRKKDVSVNISCTNKPDTETLKKTLSDKLSDNFSVEVQTLKNPKMKVMNFQNKMSLTELEEDINSRNFNNFTGKCKVIHVFQIKNSKGAIIEFPSDLYMSIRNNNNYIYVGHQRCKAYDDLNMSICGKCGGCGHSINKCKYEIHCIKCASDGHSIHDCNSSEIKCIHCTLFNKKYNKNRSADHMAHEVVKCETLKSRLNYIIDLTDYPILPTTPVNLHYQKKKILSAVDNKGERLTSNPNKKNKQ